MTLGVRRRGGWVAAVHLTSRSRALSGTLLESVVTWETSDAIRKMSLRLG